jgi:hypothetical protein
MQRWREGKKEGGVCTACQAYSREVQVTGHGGGDNVHTQSRGEIRAGAEAGSRRSRVGAQQAEQELPPD